MGVLRSRMIKRLAWRSIWRNRRRTIITISSIALGLTFAIFLVALGEGIYEQMIENAIRMQAGHIVLENPEYRDAPATDLWIAPSEEFRRRIESIEGVESVRSVITGQGLVRSGSGAVGVLLFGVEPSKEKPTSPMAKNLEAGAYLAEGDGAFVVIGADLAEQLDVDVGKKLVLSANDTEGNLREELCRVKGIFRTGAEEVDGYLVQAPLGFARNLFALPEDGTTELAVVLRRSKDQERVLREVRTILGGGGGGGGAVALPWQEVLVELAAYIRMDRYSNWTFQGLLVVIILFTIFNTILMSVLERKHEFAVLLALGTPPGQIRRQVMVETAFLGLVGCGAGLLLGGVVSYVFQVHGVDIRLFYKEGLSISGLGIADELRTRVTIPMLLWIGGIVYGATLLLGLLPMRHAVGHSITDTLR
ncbi:MAG: ABC transporter permease [Candidatus Eisenbacteria bacterium]